MSITQDEWDRMKEQEGKGKLDACYQLINVLKEQVISITQANSMLLDHISRINAIEDRLSRLEISTGKY